MPHDIRQALRALSRTPWIAGVIVLSIALGTGANAAVYSAVDALLFRAPAGVEGPATLVEVYTSQVNGATYGVSSYADARSFAASPALEALAAIDERDEATLRLGGRAINARVARVSHEFWTVLRMRPYLGQWRSDGSTNAEPAVISADAWRALGGDAQIVGRAVTLDGRTFTVAAVAPPRFRGLHLDRVFDIWIPLDADVARAGRGNRRLKLLGRLATGATLERLQRGLDTISRDLARAFPKTNRGTLRSPDDPRRATARRYSRVGPDVREQATLLAAVLLGATCLLLLSACVNAGSLLLSRGIARRTELTLRMALGADRARLMRQLLIESLLLAVAGAAGGVLVSTWTAGAIPALFAPEHAALLDTRVRPGVMLVTLAFGVAAGVICGLAPALASTRALSPDVLRGDPGRTGEPHGGARLRMTLVGAQLALSTIFLIGALLLTRVVDAALLLDRHLSGTLVLGSIESYDPGYRDAATPLLRRLASVRVAGWVASPPLARPARRAFVVEHGATREPVELDVNYASADYFRAMAMPVLDGRSFVPRDDIDRDEVAIVNEALAQRYFADRAVGHTLTDAPGHTVEIVGVVRTRSYRAFEGVPRPMIYYPMSRATARGFYAVVRSRTGAATVEGDVRNALHRAGPTRKLEVLTFNAHLARALAADRLLVTLVGACGALALALAVIGVYGVMADLVRRRTRDIGLRIALGAAPRHIIAAYVATTLMPAFGGVATGVLCAAAMVQIARSLVFGLPAIDARILATVVSGLTIVVIVAIAPPARRALRVSPLLAFRDQL